MMKIKIVIFFLLLGLQMNAQKRRSNPIVSHMFTADASAHVWNDGRLYVYPSTDVAPSKGYKTMDGYHVFSTDDMITWKDHGEILHSRDVDWGIESGGFMWAPDCVFKNGIYYYYFPHKNKKGVWEIGVATSKKPASDFKLQGYVKGMNRFCDPGVFIDDDGQAYIYAVVDAKPFAAKLKENMMEIEGEMTEQIGATGHREGPFVIKRKGIYYLIYPDHFPKTNKMGYAMSKSPLGPWEFKGVFLDNTDVITMHGSLVEFKGQWYVFYHNGNLSGSIGTNRSICFDPVYFNEDGTIQMVKQSLGVTLPTFHQDINFNEMFGTLDFGEYTKLDLEKKGIQINAISSIQIPKGFEVTCFEKDHFEGKSWTFQEDRIDLNAIDANNQISSIKITKPKIENFVKNPSFEIATQGLVKHWFNKRPKPYERYRDETAKGYYSLKYEGKGTPKPLVQKLEIEPNTKYELSVQLKVKSGTKGKVIFDTNGAFDKTCKFELDAKNKSEEWVTFKAEFNSGKTTKLQLRSIISKDFDGVGYWDNVSLIKIKE
ncbi:family 43 glycosylhydrolase [Polaribacter vadi]|uniref:family 43 glycosylhydrolase n=1 Tax=Polaribacter TaxID=52959 RepID=UPI001C09B4DE|nr:MULTISPECIES: family 43 glycosylhydrolase [Polaribacter]MBU3011345.1 family 43 glycosylhydrolase [Polaribacter vadi]MDO6741157.1 family 43 glycosylhydrolase [Polaribacter sp. 1_MG-2023]